MNTKYEGLSHIDLNALLITPVDGRIQFDADKEATRRFFIDEINDNTVFFHDLEEKIGYLIENEYYDPLVFEQYDWEDIKALYKFAYSFKFRFDTYAGAKMFYYKYALKKRDGSRYLERFEDRVVAYALESAQGNIGQAYTLVELSMLGMYQPATPTFANAGRINTGERVSCFLLGVEDNFHSIFDSVRSGAHLSAMGGGVGLNLTNCRGANDRIRKVLNTSSGLVPILKIYDDTFGYANQLGQRDGAGAAYLNIHHPDIIAVLDTKKENADESVRIKRLSLGVIVTDISLRQAAKEADIYCFSPKDIWDVYGVRMSEISITEWYDKLVADPRIGKTAINARTIFRRMAEVQIESGYPYILFDDVVNKNHYVHGYVEMSNLCSEILQIQRPSTYNEDGSYKEVGQDISCNLGSMNIAQVMRKSNGQLGRIVEAAARALTAVSDRSSIKQVPTVRQGNERTHSIGLGQMNLHGFLASEYIMYGSEESIDFVNLYSYAVAYHSVRTSMLLAKERGVKFHEFEKSKYASGEYFDSIYLAEDADWTPKTERIKQMFEQYNFVLPTKEDWAQLKADVAKYGMYNAYMRAIPPTGSISYINNSTASVHPIPFRVEPREENKIGRIYYPASGMNMQNIDYYVSAYDMDQRKVIDVYAAMQKHTDQGLSLTLFFPSGTTTREINRLYAYARSKGIKTIYYIRVRRDSKDEVGVESCVSCTL